MERESLNPEIVKKISCPLCGFEFGEGMIVSQYLMVPVEGQAQVSMPKICCLECGIEFFPPQVTEELSARMKAKGTRIIVPSPILVRN